MRIRDRQPAPRDASRKGEFCPGCGVKITRLPWPHLDRALLPASPAPEEPTK